MILMEEQQPAAMEPMIDEATSSEESFGRPRSRSSVSAAAAAMP